MNPVSSFSGVEELSVLKAFYWVASAASLQTPCQTMSLFVFLSCTCLCAFCHDDLGICIRVFPA